MNAISIYVQNWAYSTENVEQHRSKLVSTFTRAYGYTPPEEWIRVTMDGSSLYIQIRDFSGEDTDKPLWDELDNLEKAVQTVKYMEEAKERLPELVEHLEAKQGQLNEKQATRFKELKGQL